MFLFRTFLPPPNVHPIRILPPLVGLEVLRVGRVDVNEFEHLTDGTDVAGVQDRTGGWFGRAPGVGCQHVLTAGE